VEAEATAIIEVAEGAVMPEAAVAMMAVVISRKGTDIAEADIAAADSVAAVSVAAASVAAASVAVDSVAVDSVAVDIAEIAKAATILHPRVAFLRHTASEAGEVVDGPTKGVEEVEEVEEVLMIGVRNASRESNLQCLKESTLTHIQCPGPESGTRLRGDRVRGQPCQTAG
jgi:hypothetical protein